MAYLQGTPGNDTLIGDGVGDFISGFAGNDSLGGGGGLLSGGDDNDTIVAAAGSAVFGDNGDDSIVVGQGNVANGGAGNDTMFAAAAGGVLDGGDGLADTLVLPSGHSYSSFGPFVMQDGQVYAIVSGFESILVAAP